MSAHTDAIIKTLDGKPMAGSLREVMSHEGKVDGMGYMVDHVQPGRGFSAMEYSHKDMSNGARVNCETHYPGPFDGVAGRSTAIVCEYFVFIGWEVYREDEQSFDSPPNQIELPNGAIGWSDWAPDGDRSWFAKFDDPELAEAYATGLTHLVGDNTPPMIRIDAPANIPT